MVCEVIFQTVSNCVGFLGRSNLRPKGPWIVAGDFGPFLSSRDFAVGHIAWGVTSVLPIFVSHRSITYLRVIRLTDFVTQLTTVLRAAFIVTCHKFLSFHLCFNSRSRPGRSLFISERVTLLVDNLYAEATEVVKSRTALSASTPVLI
jgi:hypothetical protein